jgi:hypothetical protein
VYPGRLQLIMLLGPDRTAGEGQPYVGFQELPQQKFGTDALLLYALVNGDGNVLATFPGLTRNPEEFV